MSKTAKKIIAVALLLVLVAAAALAYFSFAPKGSAGGKELNIIVVHGNGEEKTVQISTDAENLRDALEPSGFIAGQDSTYGLFILTVDGETADESLQQWWCITKGGEALMTGTDDTMIADGEQYEFTLTTGW